MHVKQHGNLQANCRAEGLTTQRTELNALNQRARQQPFNQSTHLRQHHILQVEIAKGEATRLPAAHHSSRQGKQSEMLECNQPQQGGSKHASHE